MWEPNEFKAFLLSTLNLEASYSNTAFLAGSAAEIPAQYVFHNITDFDIMFQNDIRDILSVGRSAPPDTLKTIVVEDKKFVYPGFTRLRVIRKSVIDGRKIIEYYAEYDMKASTKNPVSGPAAELDLMNANKTYSGAKFSDRIRVSCDLVLSIFHKSWPKEAEEWIYRSRNLWPSKDVIRQIAEAGCHLVPKSHPCDPLDKTVFRYSFSIAEIKLIHTWSPAQKCVYHILRLIKKRVLEETEHENHKSPLCTYHFKTLMLWACEERPAEFWDEDCLANSIRELLCQMIEWMIERNCSNYFIRKSNLFYHLTQCPDLTTEILLLLKYQELDYVSGLLSSVGMTKNNSKISISVSKKLIVLTQVIFSTRMRCSNRLNITAAEAIADIFRSENNLIDEEFVKLYCSIEAQIRLELCKQKHAVANDMTTDCCCSKHFQDVTYFEKSLSKNDYVGVEVDLNESMEKNLEIILFRQRGYHAMMRRTSDNSRATFGLQEAYFQICITTFFLLMDECFPRLSYFIEVAYKANYFYISKRDFVKACCLCREALNQYEMLTKVTSSTGHSCRIACRVIISTRSVPIFDRFLQIIFGFSLIVSKLGSDCNAKSWIRPNEHNATKRSVPTAALHVDPILFILYLNFQCSRSSYNHPDIRHFKLNLESYNFDASDFSFVFLLSAAIISLNATK